MNAAINRIWIRVVDERGASMVEYAFLVALIAIVAIAGVTFFGGEVSESFIDSTTDMFGGS